MARVLTAEQFRNCPKGTVFAFGARWAFGRMLVLDEIVGPFEDGAWGFYATDPMWVDADDEDVRILERMIDSGESAPIATASSKYMSYDGDAMDVFFVLDAEDWSALTAMAKFDGKG